MQSSVAPVQVDPARQAEIAFDRDARLIEPDAADSVIATLAQPFDVLALLLRETPAAGLQFDNNP
jgi:hypothetical protein